LAYQIRRGRDGNTNTIEVIEGNNLIFKMQSKHDLVFATVSLNQLWVLESLSDGRDLSTEVDLETGKAKSFQMKDGKKRHITKWIYDKTTDAWELRD